MPMKTWNLAVLFLLLSILSAAAADVGSPGGSAVVSEASTGATDSPTSEWLDRDQLSGDWGGARTWLQDHGITLRPRLTQFFQGMPSGAGDHAGEYGGKADLLVNADLEKLGLWSGLSLTIHAEYNFGESVNGLGGVVVPVNTALYFPGMEGADSFDLSSVYFVQTFGESATLAVGKINMIDIAAGKPFMGGAGISAFWNTTFTAPPSGTVPPYLLGALLSVHTESANLGLWVYDPTSVVNRSGLEDAFSEGVTFRGSIDVPIEIAGRAGHQGIVASYSTMDGVDLDSLGDLLLPPFPAGTPPIKNSRYYFAYLFDQFLYQSKKSPGEGVGIFGQFGISDGNPNGLYWSAFAGFGGTGLIPGRSEDNWGVGVYYDAWSPALRRSLDPKVDLRNEFGADVYYDFSITPAITIGADLQLISPTLENQASLFAGVRSVMNF